LKIAIEIVDLPTHSMVILYSYVKTRGYRMGQYADYLPKRESSARQNNWPKHIFCGLMLVVS